MEAPISTEEQQKMLEAAADMRAKLDTFMDLLSSVGSLKELHDLAWLVNTSATSLWFELRNKLVPHCPECGGELKEGAKINHAHAES